MEDARVRAQSARKGRRLSRPTHSLAIPFQVIIRPVTESCRHLKILAIVSYFPMPDRTAGDLRFFHLLRLLARSHEVFICLAHGTGWQQAHAGREKTEAYKALLGN